MKKKTLLLLLGMCLMGVVLVCANSTVNEKTQFVATINAINVLNNDLVATMSENPTIETIGKAQMILDQRSPAIREQIKKLRDRGRLEKNPGEQIREERSQMDECINQNIEKIAEYYEKFTEQAQTNLESLDDMKYQYRNSKMTANESENLRKRILQKTELIKENYDVIKAIEVLMASEKVIYREIDKESKNV